MLLNLPDTIRSARVAEKNTSGCRTIHTHREASTKPRACNSCAIHNFLRSEEGRGKYFNSPENKGFRDWPLEFTVVRVIYMYHPPRVRWIYSSTWRNSNFELSSRMDNKKKTCGTNRKSRYTLLPPTSTLLPPTSTPANRVSRILYRPSMICGCSALLAMERGHRCILLLASKVCSAARIQRA